MLRTIGGWVAGAILGYFVFWTFYTQYEAPISGGIRSAGGTITVSTQQSYYLVVAAFVISGAALVNGAVKGIIVGWSYISKVLFPKGKSLNVV